MNQEEFRKKIKLGLTNLDNDQKVLFAWRCGIRALPFLGKNGNFNFWSKQKRQKHLYSIFYALDAAASAAFGDNDKIELFCSLILEDLEGIINKKPPQISIKTYGKIWDNFKKALSEIDCQYWADLYQYIFENDFKLDQEALIRRINVPAEIREQGAASVAKFLKEIESHEQTSLNEAKILIVGQGAVGKTSLVKSIVGKQFDSLEEATHGINIERWLIPVDHPNTASQNVQVNIWDFGGQEIMHATHQFFLTKRSLYLLVLDSRKGEYESNLHYWLKIIQSYGGDAPALIVMNKCDEFRMQVNEPRLSEDYHPNIKGFVYASAKTGEGIEQLKEMMQHQILQLPHVFDKLPQKFLTIKKELEKEAEKKDYLDISEYQEICKRYDLEDKQSQSILIRFLHDLGSILNFDDPSDPYNLNDTNVLNPEWVTGAVYKIINSKALFQREGELEAKDLDKILGDSKRYPKSKHKFILEVMRKFELCFQFPKSKTKKYLIPELLPAREPKLEWDESDALNFEYHYNVLPGGLISRLIVRNSKYLGTPPVYWRSGVILNIRSNKCKVRANINEGKIFISIKDNPKTRKDALQIIRNELEQIHTTIPKLEVKEKVPLPDDPKVLADFQHLMKLLELGEKRYIPEGAQRQYDVEELLTGIQSTIEDRPQTFYIRKLTLQNIRCFENLEIDFLSNGQPRPITLLLGDNGVGKTTVLRAIALGICDETTASSLMEDLEGDFLRENTDNGEITIEIGKNLPDSVTWKITTKLKRKRGSVKLTQEIPEDMPLDGLFACGYGALRGNFNPDSFEHFDLSDSVRSLFNYKASLQNPELVFRRLESAGFNMTNLYKKISEVLLLEEGAILMDGSGIKISGEWGSFKTIGAIGDGYQATLAWVSDFIGWALSYDDRFIATPFSGLVFVDEIEKHLHPRWQRKIIHELHTQFPFVQFIVSSHSPICAGGIADLDEGRGGIYHLSHNTEEIGYIEAPAGWRYDQILTSSAFGLTSARDLSTEIILAQLSELHNKYGEEVSEQKEFQKAMEELEDRSVIAAQDEVERQQRIDLINELKSLNLNLEKEKNGKNNPPQRGAKNIKL